VRGASGAFDQLYTAKVLGLDLIVQPLAPAEEMNRVSGRRPVMALRDGLRGVRAYPKLGLYRKSLAEAQNSAFNRSQPRSRALPCCPGAAPSIKRGRPPNRFENSSYEIRYLAPKADGAEPPTD
jgi:hypothetical protein